MSQATSITLTQPLTTLLPREKVEPEARRLGVVVRRRAVDIPALVWTLVLGFQEGAHRSIVALYWAYQQATGHSLSRSSFYDRFTPQLATLLRQLAQESITALSPASGGRPYSWPPSGNCWPWTRRRSDSVPCWPGPTAPAIPATPRPPPSSM